MRRYSRRIAGDRRNHRWPVQYDIADGYCGITQWGREFPDRVLLSPGQVRALIKFLRHGARVRPDRRPGIRPGRRRGLPMPR